MGWTGEIMCDNDKPAESADFDFIFCFRPLYANV